MKKHLVLALLAAGLTQGALAGFIDQSASNPFADNPQMRVLGSDRFDELPGFARDVSLHEALSQIVPRNYTVRTRGIEPIAATLVSWQGGKDWNLVLRDVLAQVPPLQVEIDTSSKIVTFSLRSSFRGRVSDTQSGNKGEVGPLADIPPPVWLVQLTDTTVRGTFERWARHAGWQLVWELEVDFPIDAEASISTHRFEDAVEMVTKALQGADVPPKAIIYRGNNVLRIVARGTE